jgi:hypothetical protein
MLGTEIIARRTYNPRCLRLEIALSLLRNFANTSSASEICERSKARTQTKRKPKSKRENSI